MREVADITEVSQVMCKQAVWYIHFQIFTIVQCNYLLYTILNTNALDSNLACAHVSIISSSHLLEMHNFV